MSMISWWPSDEISRLLKNHKGYPWSSIFIKSFKIGIVSPSHVIRVMSEQPVSSELPEDIDP